MPRVILAPFLLLIGVAGCSRTTPEQNWESFTATAYSVEGQTSSGAVTRDGHTVAADRNVLPVGTTIEIRGAGSLSGRYVVQDSGPRVQGRKIDIFVSDGKAAREFGEKKVEVRVVRTADKGE